MYVILTEDTKSTTHIDCELADNLEKARHYLKEQAINYLLFDTDLKIKVKHDNFCTLIDDTTDRTIDIYIIEKTLL